VQVFDFGVAEGLTYLVMELVTGEDLARHLRVHGPMPFQQLGKIVIQVCASLAEAHQKGIVHRDVKPENVMLVRGRDGGDLAKVLDFGLAKVREGTELNDVTSQGAIVGTPYFMAPEQIRGEAVDHRTDIYALGALMYRALTGHYPFNGPTPMSVFTKHLTESPTPPSLRSPELAIPSGMSAIVLKALQKNPADRFPKIEDLQAALVAEVRAAGTSSVEELLDSGQVRRIAKASADADARKAELATRDEIDTYERKLRRKRWYVFVAMGFALAVAGWGARKLYLHERAELRRGHEVEPNDTAPQATPLPFGTSITGQIGKRHDQTHGDRDFYLVNIPAPAVGAPAIVSIKTTALPNFATCTMLYKKGQQSALGQYCVGRPGRDLAIDALRVEPGAYLLAVLQDMDPYGGAQVYVHENISDTYVLTVGTAPITQGVEIEPNDAVASANPVAPGAKVSGSLAWARDEDVYCVAPGTKGDIRWKVTDQRRDGGAVLEVTPMAGTLEGAAVRVHTGIGKPGGIDVMSPWRSARIADEGDTPRCLRLRATGDPWAGNAAANVPAGSGEDYTVEVEKD
jgi:serine/threonine-protein kinase